ncbi:hypothetical protein Ae168Ps1_0702c [Pseudonocardia sp. Ae168_Ps1]|nr:hypothetical protein Ae168Ps1_0702c [Pseudonocardia sp. Ae168_Ps1]OLL92392.1 hypothetical protein Ae356Ps1_2289c [Pseudonocardia sp. Ae356_Ps1]
MADEAHGEVLPALGRAMWSSGPGWCTGPLPTMMATSVA